MNTSDLSMGVIGNQVEIHTLCVLLQVYCLKALRAIESGQGIDPRYKVMQMKLRTARTRNLSLLVPEQLEMRIRASMYALMKRVASMLCVEAASAGHQNNDHCWVIA